MPKEQLDNKFLDPILIIDPILDCNCIDAAIIFDIRQALNIAKEKYEEKAKYYLGKGRTTDYGRYYNKLRRADSIINKLKNVKVCSEML